LSPKILITLLAVPALLIFALLLHPGWTLAAVATAAVLVLIGGALVAVQARLVRNATSAPPIGGGLFRAGAAVFLASAGILVLLCAPGPYFKDGGELAASAHVLGVPHPTGFPLFCMLGKAFDLLPLGNAFFRLNVMSAVMTALAAAFAFALAVRIDAKTGRSDSMKHMIVFLVAPTSFLASNTVWLHATTTEVYALSAAGLAATIFLFTGAVLKRDARLIALGWFGVGIGLGGHVTWPIYGGMAGLVVSIGPMRRAFGGWKGAAYVTAGLVAGAMVVLYLPFAASRDPIMNWGDPSGLSGLWAHLSGARIRHSFNDQIARFNLAELRAHASMAAGILWQGTGPVWPLAVLGAVWSKRRTPLIGLVLLGVLAADFMFASWVNPMGTWDLQTLVSGTWAISVLAAIGVAGLWRGAKSGWGRTAVAVIAVTAVGLQAWMAGADRDMTTVNGPHDISSGLLKAAPIGASLLTTSDDLSAGLAALQVVENARPDILQLVRQHISDTGYVRRQVRAHRAFPTDTELLRTLDERPFESNGESAAESQYRLLSILDGRGSVFVEPGNSGTDSGIRRSLDPGFPAYSLRRDAVVDGADLIREVHSALDDALKSLPGCDRWGKAYVGVFLRLLAMHAVLAGAGDALAIDILRKALFLNPGDSRTLQNLGVLVFNSGRRDEGLELMRQSVSIDAAYVRGWKTLARYAAIAGLADLESTARAHTKALSQ